MTTYAEMDRLRKLARPLYLELRALGLDLQAEEDPETPTGYRVDLTGGKSLTRARRPDKAGRRGGHLGASKDSVGALGLGPRSRAAGRGGVSFSQVIVLTSVTCVVVGVFGLLVAMRERRRGSGWWVVPGIFGGLVLLLCLLRLVWVTT